MIGSTIGNYRIERRIAEGGMGEIYEAVDVMLDRRVAVKCLRPELARRTDILDRFRTEAQLLARLHHPHIATIYSFFSQGEGDDERYFLVMEYVDGETLEQRLRRVGRMSVDEALELFRQALEGIGAAHARGVLHRDLKPSNLMLDGSGVVKVLDFGIAHALGDARRTQAGNIVGTMEYMAPEQIRGGDIDARTDVYSLGIVLYELVSGRVPFGGGTEFEIMRAHLEDTPPEIAGTPAWLSEVLRIALHKDPAQRFADVAEFSAAIDRHVPRAAAAVLAVPAATAAGTRSTLATLTAALAPLTHGARTAAASVSGLASQLSGRQALLLGVLLLLVLGEIVVLAAGDSGPAADPVDVAAGPTEPEPEPRYASPITPPKRKVVIPNSELPLRPGPAPNPPSSLEPGPEPSGPSEVASAPPPSIKIAKADVHDSIRQGQSMGYNLSFNLGVPKGRTARVDEIVEIWRGGQRITREVVNSQSRRAGRNRSKHRVNATQQLSPGTYSVRLDLVAQSGQSARHTWSLEVR